MDQNAIEKTESETGKSEQSSEEPSSVMGENVNSDAINTAPMDETTTQETTQTIAIDTKDGDLIKDQNTDANAVTTSASGMEGVEVSKENEQNTEVVETESTSAVAQVNGQKEVVQQDVIQHVVAQHDVVQQAGHVESSKQPEHTQENGNKADSVPNNTQPPPENGTLGSLCLLSQYNSSSDEDEDSSSEEESDSDSEYTDSSDEQPAAEKIDSMANQILKSVTDYRDTPYDISKTDSDDSDVECLGNLPNQTIDITNDDEIREFLDQCDDNTSSGPIKAKGEFTIDDLPPIADLTITVPESECVELGQISGIVDTLVLVESLPNFAAVDIDTVLFLDKGNRTLGQVFDVMGNVSSPIYCVRFNKTQDIAAKNVTVGLKVFVAPQTEYTNFIVLSDLMKSKGCDASWENDNEAPDNCEEFSDDEEERLNRRNKSQQNRNKNRAQPEELPEKVCVKSEQDAKPNRKDRRPKYNKPRNVAPTRFYKDNRGYANQDAGHYYPQQMQPAYHNYSWHTAGMHAMPGPSTSAMPYPPYGSPANAPHMYPNPYAMQNPINYGPFNLQAFPPLPPPTLQPPPNMHNRRKSNSFHKP